MHEVRHTQSSKLSEKITEMSVEFEVPAYSAFGTNEDEAKKSGTKKKKKAAARSVTKIKIHPDPSEKWDLHFNLWGQSELLCERQMGSVSLKKQQIGLRSSGSPFTFCFFGER